AVSQKGFPKILLSLMGQGYILADVQIKELLTDIQYPENLYALKYILENKGDEVSVEVLKMAMEHLYPQKTDEVFSEETPIKLEWQLRTAITVLEQLCQNKCQFTSQFLDGIRKARSVYKK